VPEIGAVIAGIVGAVETAGAAVAAIPAEIGGAVGAGAAGLGLPAGIAAGLGGAAEFGLAGAGLGALVGGGEALITGGKPLAAALKGAEFGGLGGAALGGIGGATGLLSVGPTTAGSAGAAGAGAGSPAAAAATAAPPGVPVGLAGSSGGDITAFQGISNAPAPAGGSFTLDTAGFNAPTSGVSIDATGGAAVSPGYLGTGSNVGQGAGSFPQLDAGTSSFTGTAADGTPLPPIRPPGIGTDALTVTPSGGTLATQATGLGNADPLSSAGGAISQLGSSATNTVGGAAQPKGAGDIGGALGKGLTSLASNPGLLLAGGLLGLDALQSQKKPLGQTPLIGAAAGETAQAAQLQSYLSTGTLPPGIQTQLSSANEAAAATIRSQYASRGMSGSSAEAQDLASLNERTVGQGSQIALSLFNTGLTEAQMANSIYAQLMQTSINQDNQLSGAIANFAGSLAYTGARQPTTSG
jgi:hypothetical protein